MHIRIHMHIHIQRIRRMRMCMCICSRVSTTGIRLHICSGMSTFHIATQTTDAYTRTRARTHIAIYDMRRAQTHSHPIRTKAYALTHPYSHPPG